MNLNQSIAITYILLATTPAAFAEPRVNYSGYIVCQKLSTTRNLLQSPVSVVIDGEKVVLTRPIFNPARTFVVSNESALGSISPNGEIQIESRFDSNESSFIGKYSGSLKDESGILRGAQEWTMTKGAESRQCSIAFIQHK